MYRCHCLCRCRSRSRCCRLNSLSLPLLFFFCCRRCLHDRRDSVFISVCGHGLFIVVLVLVLVYTTSLNVIYRSSSGCVLASVRVLYVIRDGRGSCEALNKCGEVSRRPETEADRSAYFFLFIPTSLSLVSFSSDHECRTC